MSRAPLVMRVCQYCGDAYWRDTETGKFNKRYCCGECYWDAMRAASVAKWQISADGRICGRCLQYRQAHELYPHSGRPGGFHEHCRTCQSNFRLRRNGKPTREEPRPCKQCGVDFRQTHGHDQYCSQTCRDARSAWVRRENRLRRQYGVSQAWYEERLRVQGGVCAICRQAGATAFNGELLAVDHCHNSGLARALLCGPCNSILGYARDDPAILRRAADYLAGFSEVAVA